MKRRMRLLAALLVGVLLIGMLCGCEGSSSVYNSTSKLEAYRAQVLQLVNEERAKAGVTALAAGPDALNDAAQKRAEELVEEFSHTRPNGTTCFSVLPEYGLNASYRGENIAMGQYSPSEVMTSWMNSDGHKANILNGNYRSMGVGYVEADGTYYWVQIFIGEGIMTIA